MRESLWVGGKVALWMTLCGGLISGAVFLNPGTNRSLHIVEQAFSSTLSSADTVMAGRHTGVLLDYWEIKTGKALQGYIFEQACLTPAGFIKCLVALDTVGRIMRLIPLNESEWVRNRTLLASFFEQFAGLSIFQPIQVVIDTPFIAGSVVEKTASRGQNILYGDVETEPVARALADMFSQSTAPSLAIVQGKP